MAGLAAGDSVFSDKREVRFGVVIKGSRCPAHGFVAGFATLTIATRMNVVQAVTGNARGRGVFIAFVGMTLFTADLAMLTTKWKGSLAVVECRILPCSFTVTACALTAQSAFVWFDCLMTVDALRRGITVLLA